MSLECTLYPKNAASHSIFFKWKFHDVGGISGFYAISPGLCGAGGAGGGGGGRCCGGAGPWWSEHQQGWSVSGKNMGLLHLGSFVSKSGIFREGHELLGVPYFEPTHICLCLLGAVLKIVYVVT